MSIIHKREVLDKYIRIFTQRSYSVDLPLNELAQGLDFFAGQCSAVFENPNDKNKPFLIKVAKKLNEFLIPEGRISKAVYKLQKSAKKPDNNNNRNNNIIIKKEEKVVRSGGSFLSVLSKKVSEVIITETVTETKIVNEDGEEIEGDKNEGKYVLQRIISEK